MSIIGCSGAWAADGEANDALLKKLEKMEQRIQMLEGKLKQKQAAAQAGPVAAPPSTPPAAAPSNAQPTTSAQPTAPARAARAEIASTAPSPTPTAPANNGIVGLADSPVPGLSIGAYGEIKFGSQQNPAANGQWQKGFDAHRIVLLPTYAITPNIIFNAEIEFEHGGIAFDSDDKRHGSAEIEQIWVDFKVMDQFNWRSPGIDLVPIGYITQHHEPTQFYSVNRPQLYNGLIPSTWHVMAGLLTA